MLCAHYTRAALCVTEPSYMMELSLCIRCESTTAAAAAAMEAQCAYCFPSNQACHFTAIISVQNSIMPLTPTICQAAICLSDYGQSREQTK